MPKYEIRWTTDPSVMDDIVTAYRNLINNGWVDPPIRTLLYQLMGDRPDRWKKKHYDRLTSFIESKRRDGTLRYGMFSSDSGGMDSIPPSKIGILEQIRNWKETTPLQLSPDGYLYLLFHEHEGMVPTLDNLFDNHIGSFSSQGQIRHEHLYKMMSGAVESLHRLGGVGIKVLGIADYDIYGAKGYDEGKGHIIRNHSDWIQDQFKEVEFYLYGVTTEQIESAGLDPRDEHQFDGWLQRYGLDNFKREIQSIVGYDDGWDKMLHTKLTCRQHPSVYFVDINKELLNLLAHVVQFHGDDTSNVADLNFITMFMEEPYIER